MFDKEPSERYNKVKELIPDYRLILIDPHQMGKASFSAMKTELNTVLKFIANANNKAELRNNIDGDETLDADAVAVINSCTGANISMPDGGEVTMMSEGIKQLIEEGRDNMIDALRAVGASEDLIQNALEKMKEKQENTNDEV